MMTGRYRLLAIGSRRRPALVVAILEKDDGRLTLHDWSYPPELGAERRLEDLAVEDLPNLFRGEPAPLHLGPVQTLTGDREGWWHQLMDAARRMRDQGVPEPER